MEKLSDSDKLKIYAGFEDNSLVTPADAKKDILTRLSDGRRAIEAMEKIFHALRELHIKGECVNCDYILKICKDYEQANSKADFFHSTEVGTSYNQKQAKEPK